MIVMNSKILLEQLTEIEDKIQKMEDVMKNLEIEVDKEGLMELLIACQVAKTGRHDSNS